MTKTQTPFRKWGRSFLPWLILLVIGHCSLTITHAHTASTAWLQLTVTNGVLGGRLEVALRDLDDALGLDANDDGELTWGELRRREADLATWLRPGLSLHAGTNALPFRVASLQVSERLDTPCAVLHLEAALPVAADSLAVDYELLFAGDPMHRCLLNLDGGATRLLSPEQTTAVLPLVPAPAGNPGLGGFIREGIHHIWTGYDHLAFLFALLLPAVLRRTPEGWRGVATFPEVTREVLKVVTAFTLAHSLTLGLAAFEIVRLPARWVEATIAASIVAAVALSFSGKDRRHGWQMAFGFGLVHGFGFAGVLGELGLARAHLARPLLGFNVGVELGQLACVLAFLPAAYALRQTVFYRRGALPLGSAGIAALATGWFVERVFDVAFMPF